VYYLVLSWKNEMKTHKLWMLLLILVSCSHVPNVSNAEKRDYILVNSVHLTLPQQLVPIVGTTTSGQKIALGGFSGLVFKEEKDGELIFQTHTDRGPNGYSIDKDRPFLLPDFTPEIVTIKTHIKDKTFEVSDELKLKKKNGQFLTGLPNHREEENPVDVNGMPTSIDKDGLDTEGITYDGEGGYWISDEYAPSLVHFDVEGKMLRRLIPGLEIPKIYSERTPNRGFEGIAKFENKLFGILQSPLPREEGLSRIVEINLETMHTSAEYFYPFEKGNDKVSDIVLLTDKKFLVIEHKKIFKITLNGSDQNVSKTLIIDLANTSFINVEKIEGIALIDNHRIAVICDNDFQISGKTDFVTGLSPFNQAKNELLILEFNQDLK
jgi:3-phytase